MGPSRHNHHRDGFTLLGMMMVLAIIGLLTGAVVVGKDLIRSSELLSVTTDVKKFSTGLNSFRDKYNAIPGDFARATDIWGDDPDGCTEQVPQTTTCDGNGNGKISIMYLGGFVSLPPEGPDNTEFFTFWQHLANAGMIEGVYTGALEEIPIPPCTVPPAIACPGDGPSSTAGYLAGLNSPQSKLRGGVYSIYVPTAGTFIVSLFMPSEDGSTTFPILAPAEAKQIDTKMDDGLPTTGTVTSSQTVTCIVWSGGLPTNQYNSGTDKACNLNFSL